MCVTLYWILLVSCKFLNLSHWYFLVLFAFFVYFIFWHFYFLTLFVFQWKGKLCSTNTWIKTHTVLFSYSVKGKWENKYMLPSNLRKHLGKVQFLMRDLDYNLTVPKFIFCYCFSLRLRLSLVVCTTIDLGSTRNYRPKTVVSCEQKVKKRTNTVSLNQRDWWTVTENYLRLDIDYLYF